MRQEGILHLPCLIEEGLKRRALRREGPQGRGLNSRLQVRFVRLPGFDEGNQGFLDRSLTALEDLSDVPLA